MHEWRGYLREYVVDEDGIRKLKYVHRLIIERYLGRKLITDEHVHHIDGNRSNNSLNNLMVLSRAEHSLLEMNCIPMKKGGHHSEETKAKISASNMGKHDGSWVTDEYRQKMSILNKAQWARRKKNAAEKLQIEKELSQSNDERGNRSPLFSESIDKTRR